MSKIKIWCIPFNKTRNAYYGRMGAWQILRIGGSFQYDYIFIDILFWCIRIERTIKKDGYENS